MNTQTTPRFRYHSVDNGYCRVYYKLEPSGAMFCFQDEGVGLIDFYICNNPEHEPTYSFKIKKGLVVDINLIPNEEHVWDKELCSSVNQYIQQHKNFNVLYK